MQFRMARIILSGWLGGWLATTAIAGSDDGEEAQTHNKENPVVIIKTSMGDITVELFAQDASKTVENFLQYADDGFYDGTIFHRVIPGFMVQGGGFDAEMNQQSTRPAIRNEAQNGLANKRGTLAMARTQVVDSATSQFFINLVDNAFLNHTRPDPRGFGYCVFGRVTAGMDVVDQMAAVATTRHGPHENVPREPIKILAVERR